MRHVAPTLERLKSREFSNSGNVTRLFFDESDNEGLYGDVPLDGVNATGVSGDGIRGRKPWTASYKTPYFGRFGHWGILHVVSVTVGVQLEGHAHNSHKSRRHATTEVKHARGGRIAGGEVRRVNEGARVCACERGPRAGGAGTESAGVDDSAKAQRRGVWLHLVTYASRGIRTITVLRTLAGPSDTGVDAGGLGRCWWDR